MIFVFKFYLLDRERSSILQDILTNQAYILDISCAEQIEAKDFIVYKFFINTTESVMIEFANRISKRLPVSLYFRFDRIEKVDIDSFDAIEDIVLISLKNNKILDAEVLTNLIQTRDFSNLEEWIVDFKYHQDSIKSLEFKEKIQEWIDKIKQEGIVIKTDRGTRLLSTTQKTSQILFWDLNSVKTYMRLDSLQAQFLASYEKPSMELCPKGVFIEEMGGNTFECILPDDIFLGILGQYCLDQEINYVYISNSDRQADISYHQRSCIPKIEKIVVAQDGYILHVKKSMSNVFELIESHEKSFIKSSQRLQNDKNLIVCFSKDNPTFFWLGKDGKYQSVLDLKFNLNPKHVIDMIEKYPDGNKLIQNFYKNFDGIKQKIIQLDLQTIFSHNIFEFFSVLSFVADYDKDFNIKSVKILENAKKYVRDKGPRIDYKIIKNQEGVLLLDYPKILRSVMSFLLAGVDEATLSYGVIDSMGECFGNFIQDICTNFAIPNLLIFGSLLEEKIFLDKILQYTPKNINLVLPKNGFLDYKE